jgi:HK97 family phage major capsid protein
MVQYNDLIDRDDAGALMPEDVAREILGNIAAESVVMNFGRRLPNMSRKTRRQPVWTQLPQAYFVNGDTGLKQSTKVAWDNTYINAEEIACYVVIPDAVLDDADYDLLGEAKPGIVSAIGKTFDQAVLYGINAPADWPDPITIGVEEHGHRVTLGSVGDLYDDLLGEGGVLSLIEEDGFMPNGHVAALRMKAKLRGLREKDINGDATGPPIFVTSRMSGEATAYSLDGEPLAFPRNGAIDPARTLMVSGDWDQLVWAVRQDITYKVITEGVITDANNEIIINLPQQDSIALRCVFRVGWALPNPINLVNEDEETRFPFATLEPVGAS